MSTRTIVAPRGIDEAADAVRRAAREGAVVLPTGGDTKRTWTRPATRVDVELSTRALAGVVAYEPGDGVVTALAGTPWAEVEALVARHGHHLSPSIPGPERATVGGVVAAGQSGLDRLRYGPVRHQVLGLRVVLADGTIARTGGRLVKNVTGFDLHRLHTGAHGTLGLVAEVSLRLHPAPELRAVGLAFRPTRALALELARAALRAAPGAWAVLVTDRAGDGARARWLVQVLLAGTVAGVEDQVARMRDALPDLPWIVGQHGTPDQARVGRSWSAIASMENAGDGWPALRVACAPSALESACAALDAAASALGIEARTDAHPGLGIADLWLRPLDEAAVARISADLARVGARVHWRGLDDALRAQVDIHGGEEPAGITLMRRIRANLDPRGLWATGRLPGGL